MTVRPSIEVRGRRGMGGHSRPGEGATVEWYTPPGIFEALGLTFDLDPCAPPGGLPWVPAGRFYSIEDEGLTQPWAGRVWLNPPYGPHTGAWMRRLAAHGHGIALVFARTETAWWQETVRSSSAVCFIAGRLTFVDRELEPGSSAEGATVQLRRRLRRRGAKVGGFPMWRAWMAVGALLWLLAGVAVARGPVARVALPVGSEHAGGSPLVRCAVPLRQKRSPAAWTTAGLLGTSRGGCCRGSLAAGGWRLLDCQCRLGRCCCAPLLCGCGRCAGAFGCGCCAFGVLGGRGSCAGCAGGCCGPVLRCAVAGCRCGLFGRGAVGCGFRFGLLAGEAGCDPHRGLLEVRHRQRLLAAVRQ